MSAKHSRRRRFRGEHKRVLVLTEEQRARIEDRKTARELGVNGTRERSSASKEVRWMDMPRFAKTKRERL